MAKRWRSALAQHFELDRLESVVVRHLSGARGQTNDQQQHLEIWLAHVREDPRRLLDEVYQNFYHTIAGHVATTIANGRAYKEERGGLRLRKLVNSPTGAL